MCAVLRGFSARVRRHYCPTDGAAAKAGGYSQLAGTPRMNRDAPPSAAEMFIDFLHCQGRFW